MLVRNSIKADTLIIGSGIAGLNLARKLAQAGQEVFVVSKEAVTEGSSKYAQGGVAVYTPLNQEDKLESHIQDTLKSGKGLCDKDVVEKILAAGWSKVEELIKLGVEFNKNFNIEGSHSYNRVMHVADATGRAILKPILDNVSRNHNVSISQGTTCLSLLKQDEQIVGGKFSTVSGEEFYVHANNTVLATGGLSSLYQESSNPEICTGDGIALAHDAGAAIEHLEFVQFHPTVFKTRDQKNFLISEAVRGAGALLRNSNKELFAQKYHPDAELATRDIVSRAIIQEMRESNSEFVYLDFTAMQKETIENEFPNIFKTCLANGFDISTDLLPVKPAAHYSIGGIKTDINGQSNIPGLYALGECASTGLHGANRLASNSLLECIVMADFVAQDILASEVQINVDHNKVLEASSYEASELEAVRKILSQYAGIERSQKGLEQALEELAELKSSFETTIANILIKSALERKESRGAHFRADFPETASLQKS